MVQRPWEVVSSPPLLVFKAKLYILQQEYFRGGLSAREEEVQLDSL
jgi:hypothetical protein